MAGERRMLPKPRKLDNDEGDKDEDKKGGGWQEVKQGGGEKIRRKMWLEDCR